MSMPAWRSFAFDSAQYCGRGARSVTSRILTDREPRLESREARELLRELEPRAVPGVHAVVHARAEHSRSSSTRVATAASMTYVGETTRSSKTGGDPPASSPFRIPATLPFGGPAPGVRPNRLSTRSTYPRGASSANHSPSSFDAPYALRGLGARPRVYGVVAVPSKTKSVL